MWINFPNIHVLKKNILNASAVIQDIKCMGPDGGIRNLPAIAL